MMSIGRKSELSVRLEQFRAKDVQKYTFFHKNIHYTPWNIHMDL